MVPWWAVIVRWHSFRSPGLRVDRRLNLPGVVIRGEPGIGKSRLAAAAAELADSSGAVVLELVGSPFHTDAGLHPVRTLLERRCGIGRLTDQAERLRLLDAEIVSCSLDPGSLVPLLAPVLGVGAEHGYQPVAEQGRKLYELIAQAVHSYLLVCLGNRMGLVVAEDAHCTIRPPWRSSVRCCAPPRARSWSSSLDAQAAGSRRAGRSRFSTWCH